MTERKTAFYLSDIQADAIIAGLRCLQTELKGSQSRFFRENIAPIYTNEDKHEGLDLSEIDELCEAVNCRTTQPDELQRLLEQAAGDWPQFDKKHEPVNGGDLVEWFGGWRRRVKAALKALKKKGGN